MTIEIRIAQFEDLIPILELQKACYQTEAELHNEFNIPPMTQTQEAIEADFKNGVLFLTGLIEGKIVASVRGYTEGITTHIGRLIVERSFQNNKFGQKIMRAIESQLNKCSRYELFTGHKSEKNLYLYQKLGYQIFKKQVVNDNLILVFLEKNCIN